MVYDVIILGSGPAGLSAAIYASRAKLKFVVIEKNMVTGGQILDTYEIDNYPGLFHVSGVDLAEKFKKHCDCLGTEFITGEVKSLELRDKIKRITLLNGVTIKAHSIVIAMGARCRKLNVEGEEKYTGMGVSYCAICDGPFFRKKETVVIGGGDSALEEALFLSRICSKVTLIHRGKQYRAALSLINKVEETKNIECLYNTEVCKIEGNEVVNCITVKDIVTAKQSSIATNGVFIAIGRDPNTDLVKDMVHINKEGYIITDSDCLTNLEGVYAAGDIREKSLRQVITAAADGAISITAVEHFLQGR